MATLDPVPVEQIIAACEMILDAQEMSQVEQVFWIGMVFLVLFGMAYLIDLIKDGIRKYREYRAKQLDNKAP